jgi:lipopolysaccharide/colanic/teichoic acid biosynthesis glycosyltransferase
VVTKRILDLTISGILLVPASLLLLLAAAITILRDGHPVAFPQERAGRFDRPFKLYKLRSMSNAVDAQGELLPDEDRLTRWGRFLRVSSIDELPQLWNVIRGDMSLVGPRPLPVRYLSRYSPEQRRRHLVRPGITGWAQVQGRNALTWDEKFALDLWYVDHRSMILDLKILCITAFKVIRRDGISQDGHATMPEFTGK